MSLSDSQKELERLKAQATAKGYNVDNLLGGKDDGIFKRTGDGFMGFIGDVQQTSADIAEGLGQKQMKSSIERWRKGGKEKVDQEQQREGNWKAHKKALTGSEPYNIAGGVGRAAPYIAGGIATGGAGSAVGIGARVGTMVAKDAITSVPLTFLEHGHKKNAKEEIRNNILINAGFAGGGQILSDKVLSPILSKYTKGSTQEPQYKKPSTNSSTSSKANTKPNNDESVATQMLRNIRSQNPNVTSGVDLTGGRRGAYAVDKNYGTSIKKMTVSLGGEYSLLSPNAIYSTIAKRSKSSHLTQQQYQELSNAIYQSSKAYGLDPTLLTAQIMHETGNFGNAKGLNFGGVTWNPSMGLARRGHPRPASEGGYYVKNSSIAQSIDLQARTTAKFKIGKNDPNLKFTEDEALIPRANLDDMPIHKANLDDTLIPRANLDDMPIHKANLDDTLIPRAKLDDMPIHRANLDDTSVNSRTNIDETSPFKLHTIDDTTPLSKALHEELRTATTDPQEAQNAFNLVEARANAKEQTIEDFLKENPIKIENHTDKSYSEFKGVQQEADEMFQSNKIPKVSRFDPSVSYDNQIGKPYNEMTTKELLQHPRLKELMESRQEVKAKDIRYSQQLENRAMTYETQGNNGVGYSRQLVPASYSPNTNADFRLTKHDVSNIRKGKITPQLQSKLQEDLATIDTHENYTYTPPKPQPIQQGEIKGSISFENKAIPDAIDTYKGNALRQEPSGEISVHTAVIRAFSSSDVSTIPHELGHYFRRTLSLQEAKVAELQFGVKDGVWLPHQEEAFANGFTKYLSTGKAPTSSLKATFEKYRQFFIQLWKKIKVNADKNFILSKPIQDFFDAVMGDNKKAHALWGGKVELQQADELFQTQPHQSDELFQSQPHESEDLIKKGVVSILESAPIRHIKEKVAQTSAYKTLIRIKDESETLNNIIGHHIYKKDDYMKIREDMLRGKNEKAENFEQLHEQLKLLSEETRLNMSRYMQKTGGEELSLILKELADEYTNIITKQGQELVDLGVLEKAQFEKFKDRYLVRSYTKHTAEKNFSIGARGTTVQGVHTRGNEWTGTKKEFEELTQKGEIGDFFDGKITATKMKNGQYKFHQDWTPEQRAKWGEIEDIAFSLPQTLQKMTEMSEHANMLKSVFDTPYVLEEEAKGYIKLEGKKFGALNGKFVPKDIADDITEFGDALFGKSESKLLSDNARELFSIGLTFWKKTHTIYNQTTHVNNIVSNISMQYMAGVNPLRAIANAKAGIQCFQKYTLWQELNAKKLIGLSDEEALHLRALEVDTDLMLYRSAKQKGLFGKSELNDILKKYITKTDHTPKAVMGAIDKKLETLYGAEDDVMRFSMLKGIIEKDGLDIDTAIKTVNDTIPDYTKPMSAWARAGRSSGLTPFISWTYYSTPIILRQLRDNPTRAVGLLGALYGINRLMGIDPYDERDIPQDNFSMHRLPIWKDGNEITTLKIDKWLPHTAVVAPLDFAKGLTSGGVYGTPVDMIYNRNSYFNKQLTHKEGAGKAYDYIKTGVQYATPDIVDNLYNLAESKITTKEARKSDPVVQPRTPIQEIFKQVGLNFQSYNKENQKIETENKKLRKEKKEARDEKKRLETDYR